MNIFESRCPIAIKFHLKNHWDWGKAALGSGSDRIRTVVSMVTDWVKRRLCFLGCFDPILFILAGIIIIIIIIHFFLVVFDSILLILASSKNRHLNLVSFNLMRPGWIPATSLRNVGKGKRLLV